MKLILASMVMAAGAAQAATVDLYWFKSIDTSTTADSVNNAAGYVGNNVSAIAWSGTDLYIGGYNQSGGTATTAIAKITDATGNQSFGNAFGAVATTNSRGISGLAYKNGKLAAALDNGAGSGDSVRAFDNAGNLNWRIGTSASDTTRRGNGVAFDPGFGGAGSNQGVAYLSIGSGRRHLLDANTGAYINGQNAGGVINFSATSTVWRDLVFDTNGDLYTRESNRIGKAVRTGDNSFSTQVAIGGLTASGTVDNENIELMAYNANKYLIVNDRSSAAGGQAFGTVIKIFDTAGNLQTINWHGFDLSAAAGNGAYDFSYNSTTGILAVSDFAKRQVYLFSVPAPGAASVLGLAGLMASRRRR